MSNSFRFGDLVAHPVLRGVLLTVVFGGVAVLVMKERDQPVTTSTYRPEPTSDATPYPSAETLSESAQCVACHAWEVNLWQHSQHALANRWIADANLTPGTALYGGVETVMTEEGELRQQAPDGFQFEGKPVAVIGVEPLVQPLVVTEKGRWQVFNPAYHSQTNGWFNAFPDVRNSSDWGHWSNRGMTWNVQCAWCHMTDFKKNYDPEEDVYRSEWVEMGISCAQCHGDSSAHAGNPEQVKAARFNRITAQENCLSCHARREFLTPEHFKAGESFAQHFRMELFDREGVYYPDGQVQDENFEATSFLSSKMHDAGVTCFDCHNPHSGKLILPVENNALCMSCHTTPGRMGAKPVNPAAHSHHAETSTGNRCVECHMPETRYMQADMRRDHGFMVPDPMLTRTLGIPNACNRCHQDQTVAWAEAYSERWYGEALEKRRTRPRVIAAARHQEPGVGAKLVELALTETNEVWRATLVQLMGSYLVDRAVLNQVLTALKDPSPLVRAAAVRVLSPYPAFQTRLLPLRSDPNRMVRLDAAWATLERGGFSEKLDKELKAWIRFNGDQPAGILHLAEAAVRQGKPEEAVTWAKRLLELDASVQPQVMAGRLFHAAGETELALAAFERAVALDPGHVEGWYVLAMFRGEQGNVEEAMDAFRRVVLLEPEHGRAWYNLGLAQVKSGSPDAGLLSLGKAEQVSLQSADPAYAAATVYAQQGKRNQAIAALERALKRDPQHRPSLQLMRQLRTGR
jgi:predicted CXXCH cytochrome family protein